MRLHRNRLTTLLTIGVFVVGAALYIWTSARQKESAKILSALDRFDALEKEHSQRFEKIKKLGRCVQEERGLLIIRSFNPVLQPPYFEKSKNQLSEIAYVLDLALEQSYYVISAIAYGLDKLQENPDNHYDELAEQLLKSLDELIAKAETALKKYQESIAPNQKPPR